MGEEGIQGAGIDGRVCQADTGEGEVTREALNDACLSIMIESEVTIAITVIPITTLIPPRVRPSGIDVADKLQR